MEQEQIKKRPITIQVICIISFVGAIATLFKLFDPSYGTNDVRILTAVASLVGLTSMIGLWYMKKWGVLLYGGIFLFNQVILLFVLERWSAASFFLPGIVLVIGAHYYDRMD